mgnify:CR=1 FL=1
MENRFENMTAWLAENPKTAGCRVEPASVDASFRKYYRVYTEDGPRIVMDAPPDRESCATFIDVTARLHEAGVHAPAIFRKDLQRGFLLLSDLGKELYLDALNEDTADELYDDAITTLVTMQKACRSEGLPPYDEQLLRSEMLLFQDWLVQTHVGHSPTTAERNALSDICNSLVTSALQQPQVFVHRDYHSRNLAVHADHNPGVLDYQDAVRGPVSYDIVSLLKDCYVKWPAANIRYWLNLFHERSGHLLADTDPQQLLRWFDLMGVQRHLKASGIFCRLYHRDGKAGYLGDIPRTLGYILDLRPDYPELEPLCDLIESAVLPRLSTGAA